MEKVQKTSSYVIMLDIVGFSERAEIEQAESVSNFLKLIKENLYLFEEQDYNIFPTGDGAIICMYERTRFPDSKICLIPLEFSKAILKANIDNDFNLRISINYSHWEQIIDVSDFDSIDTNHIQIGNGINIAERIIHFCEPNEIIVSKDYHKVLSALNIHIKKNLHPHRDVFVKHMKNLEIFSYIPVGDENDYIYNLKSEGREHSRKYAYFPPIPGEIFKKFKKIGLEQDLQNTCDYAYDTLALIHKEGTHISWGTIFDTLKKVPIHLEEEVLVISRNDMENDFWSTDGAKKYIKYLERMQHRYNHYRIFIYDPEIRTSIPKEILDKLIDLHAPGTLKQIDKGFLSNLKIMKYLLGVTIFPENRCAIAPLPAPSSYNEYIETIKFTKVEDIFIKYRHIDFDNYNMKAFIINNEEIVDHLIREFNKLKINRNLEDMQS